jgi:uncharacterized lipoprotein NlpE involved in copper resistance
MKKASLAVATLLIASLAIADTFTNWTSSGVAITGQDRLTLTPANGEETITIPEDATITVLDDEGNPVDPQPSLHIRPSTGTASTQYRITKTDGTDFEVGEKVQISSVSSSGSSKVDGAWSDSSVPVE